MTCFAAITSGTARPISRQVSCNAPAISAVESASVPSQSKASKLKRRGDSDIAATRVVESADEGGKIGRQRRFENQRPPVDRMHQFESRRVQEHALQSLPGKHLVPCEIAVFV